MNVLLTSVGRRGYLVDYFRKALAGEGEVIAANMYPATPGMYAADRAIVCPPAKDPDYVDVLLEICRKHHIGLLCSLHDLDVFMLSQQRHRFVEAGIATTLPDPVWGRMALDKYHCTRALEAAGFPVPWTALGSEQAISAVRQGGISFPLVVKSRFGFGSLGLRLCHDEDELINACRITTSESVASGIRDYLTGDVPDLTLIQAAIQGREVCLGVCNDFSGNYRAHFACAVHAMRAGESDSATSLDRQPFTDLARRISELTRHAGIWGIDFLEDNGVLRAIDVNPRFTGDYPFHHLAGADVPAALLAWASGHEPDLACFNHRPGITGYKDLVPRPAPSPR